MRVDIEPSCRCSSRCAVAVGDRPLGGLGLPQAARGGGHVPGGALGRDGGRAGAVAFFAAATALALGLGGPGQGDAQDKCDRVDRNSRRTSGCSTRWRLYVV